MWPFWLLFGIAAVIAIGWMVRIEQGRSAEHAREFRAAAEANGAAYTNTPPEALLHALAGFELLHADGAALPQNIRDVLTRTSAAGVAYAFVHERHGTGGSTTREAAVCVISPGSALPRTRPCEQDGVSIEAAGDAFLAYRSARGRSVPVAELLALLGEAHELRERFRRS